MLLSAVLIGMLLVTTHAQEDHDVRLSSVSGKAGRVEVYNSGQWGIICKEGWDFYDVLVVCKQLGFPWVDSVWSTLTVPAGDGPRWLSGVQCSGSESKLDLCPNDGWTDHDCGDDVPALGACLEESEITSTTVIPRLYGGGNGVEGKIVLSLQPRIADTREYFVCDEAWDMTDADVVCRQLGYHSAAKATTFSYFGRHDPEDELYKDVEFLASEFACTGSESNIISCPAQDWFKNRCQDWHEAGVICNRIEEPEGFALRLVGGNTTKEGRVEVFLNGEWGSICKTTVHGDIELQYEETNVICQQLDQGYGVEAVTDDRFGRSSLPSLMTGHFSCYGGEPSFAQCENIVRVGQTTPEECNAKEDKYDVSVICSGPVAANRSPIKLNEKELLIYHDGRWGSICSNGWTMKNAKVACRELDMGPPEEAKMDSLGLTGGPIYLANVSCTGEEKTLDECDRSEWYEHTCNHAMDVAIQCTERVNGGVPVTSAPVSLILAFLTAVYCIFEIK